MKRRPKKLQGITHKPITGCGALLVTINDHDGMPYELIAHLGKAGTCGSALTESIARVTSLALQAGVDIKVLSKTLVGISCPAPSGIDQDKILSCADAIGQCLRTHFQEIEAKKVKNETQTV